MNWLYTKLLEWRINWLYRRLSKGERKAIKEMLGL